MHTQYILAVGSPFAGGLAVHGPFASHDAAEDCALNSFVDQTWHVVPVRALTADADEFGDGAATEEAAQSAALAILVTIAEDFPAFLGDGRDLAPRDAHALVSDLAAALRESPALLDYLTRVAGGTSEE